MHVHLQRALVRRPSPRLSDGLVTHVQRQPIDRERALQQWSDYRQAMHDHGWETVEAPPADDCPDGVFIEDTMVVDASGAETLTEFPKHLVA